MFVPAKVVAPLDAAEENDARKGVDEHHQQHAGDDEETLEARAGNGQHEHLQSGLFEKKKKTDEYFKMH